MRIKRLDGLVAQCEAKGIERSVNLLMLEHEPLSPGDYLVVHLGYATQKISEADARAAWALYDELLAAEASESRG